MRSKRPHMPGVAFHITARLQGWHPWFKDETADAVEEIILEGVNTSDAIHLAHCVMPTHFHLVMRQGNRSLGWVMQPIMRRIALHIQQRRHVVGHVWERRFHSVPAENADQLRNAVTYTHLNPWRKGLCADLSDYPWSSHASYTVDASGQIRSLNVLMSLQLFSTQSEEPHPELVASYARCLRWRMEKDRHKKLDIPFSEIEPMTSAGDEHFLTTFCQLSPARKRRLPDLRDRAIVVLAQIDSDLTIDRLRGSYLPRRYSEIRRQIFEALLQYGYQVTKIADYFRVSAAAVSRVAVAMRLSTKLKVKPGP